MEERLVIIDAEGYTIEVDDNYGGVEDTKAKLAENPNLDAVFVAVTDPYGRPECVALTLEQAEKLAEEIQKLIKVLKA
jgi:hypothetical protein